jgi:hypothetical protein
MTEQDKLTTALREARLAESAQLESILNLRDAKSLRLETLRTALVPLVSGHAAAMKLFELNVQSGANPRLWIDLISSVVMEPDPRTYRLVQDHDGQRETLFESGELQETVDFLTRYLAHRIVLHDRAAAGLSNPYKDLRSGYSLASLIYVWITGCTFGVLGLLVAAILLGKLHF